MGARVDFVCFEDFVNDAHGPDSLAQPHSSRTMKPRFGCSLFFSGATWHLVYEISHIIKGRPFGVGFECLAHSLQERNTLYD
jgi:hypothetical protein